MHKREPNGGIYESMKIHATRNNNVNYDGSKNVTGLGRMNRIESRYRC